MNPSRSLPPPFPLAARLYLVLTRSLCAGDPLSVLEDCLEGGVDLVQVREPEAGDRDLLGWLRRVREVTLAHRIPLIVNNRADLAELLDADGVHVGQDDLPVPLARTLTKGRRWVGLSTHSVEQIRAAEAVGADSIGIGPIFDTKTKGLDGLGLEHLSLCLAAATVPAFGIGGLSETSLPRAVEAGLRRAAVSSALCGARDPRRSAEILLSILKSRDPGPVAPGTPC